MITVKLDNPVLGFPLGRQTPGASCRWGDYQFFINKDREKCDHWVVGERLLDRRSKALSWSPRTGPASPSGP